MPNVYGDAAAQQLRRAGYDGPIIAITSNTMREDTSKYIEVGMNAVMHKPVTLHRIQQILDMIRNQRSSTNPAAPYTPRIINSV